MIKIICIFVMLILVDSFGLINRSDTQGFTRLASTNYHQSKNVGVNMFKSIPGYPNYQFNTETLEVKSLERRVPFGNRYKVIQEKILKPYLGKDGYFRISVLSKGNHRTAKRSQISWLVEYGVLLPKPFQIDHIDADKTNDHISNLQALTPRDNTTKGFNQRGKTLPDGVSWHKRDKKFQARILINGKRKHLGYFVSANEASLAYQNELEKT